MRTTWTLLTAMLLAWPCVTQADEPSATPDADAAAVAQPATADVSALQAQMHRAMAELIEAQSGEKPDAAEIARLAEQVRTLRAQLWTQAPGPQMAAGWGGRGWGRGPAYGAGRGWGYGPAYGAAYGRGAGYGPGRGYGRGPGWQRGWGAGVGPWFVDADGDGVCDRYQPPVTR